MKQEFRKTSELKLWEDNPRNIKPKDFERLKKQIQELGQYKPLLITEDGTVIGGNMRLRAYMDLGIEDIWVSVVNPKDDNQMLAYALSDNDRAGYYDDDLLANLSSAYPDFEWGDYAVDLAPPTTLDELIDGYRPQDGENDLLPNEDRRFTQITFTLSLEQAELVNNALVRAKDDGYDPSEINQNSNGNALFFIVERYINES